MDETDATSGRGEGGGGSGSKARELKGQARPAGAGNVLEPASITLDGTGLTLQVGTGRPIRAGYRDLSLIAIAQSKALLVMGDGPDTMRWMLEQFGNRLGPLVRDLRERRFKQRLSDGLVKVPDDAAELVEFDWQPTADPMGPGSDGPAAAVGGVGQLVIHDWGFVVSPIDERTAWINYRRASIVKVTQPSAGDVTIDGEPGRLTVRGLGQASTRLHDTLQRLRDGAFADAAGLVEQLMPDASFGVRQKASEVLVDGRPTRPEVFGDAGWPIIETAVLGDPTFADSYQSLCTSAGTGAPRWVAMSPEDPGGTNPKIWFLVALPGNLVALELVTGGAHATYFFRVMPRAQYKGESPDKLGVFAQQAVRDVSKALVDCRFLREPMALPADQLRLPKYLRYRLALAVLPTLAAARGRFVARVVHRDPASWSAAVADLIRWHAGAKDEATAWPGRAVQEAEVSEAGDDDGEPAQRSSPPDPDGPPGPPGPDGDGDNGAAASGKSKPSGTPG